MKMTTTPTSYHNPYGCLEDSTVKNAVYKEDIKVNKGSTFKERIPLTKRNTFSSIGTAVTLNVKPEPPEPKPEPVDDQVEYTDEDDSYFNSITRDYVEVSTEDEEIESGNLLDNEFEVSIEQINELQSKLTESPSIFEPLLLNAATVLVGVSEASDRVKAITADHLGFEVDIDSAALDVIPVLTNLSLTLKLMETLNIPKNARLKLTSALAENIGIDIAKMLKISGSAKSKELQALYNSYSAKLKGAGLEEDTDNVNLLGVKTSRK